MSFPTNPINGQSYKTKSGVIYVYTSADDKWNKREAFLTTATKNKITNGAMDIDQRREGGTAICFNTGARVTNVLDRYAYGWVNGAQLNIARDTNVPSGTGLQNSMRCQVNVTADPTITDGEFGAIFQAIEGYNARPLVANGFMTLSFWVYSNVTGTYCVTFRNSNLLRNYVVEYPINVGNAWEKKIIVVDIRDGASSGTWDYSNGRGLEVLWNLTGYAAVGTYVTDTPNVWVNANKLTTPNQVNFLAAGNTFYLTGVQLEAGTAATDFEHEEPHKTLKRCHRHYHKTSTYGAGVTTNLVGQAINHHYPYIFHTDMRAAPTALSFTVGTQVNFPNPGAGFQQQDTKGVNIYKLSSAVSASGSYWYGQAFFDAEIQQDV